MHNRKYSLLSIIECKSSKKDILAAFQFKTLGNLNNAGLQSSPPTQGIAKLFEIQVTN